MLRYFTCLALIVISCHLFAQQNADVRLAYNYLQGKEYDKALVLYEKLFEQTQSRAYFEFMVQCQLGLKQYDDAEKLVKRQMKRNNTDLTYHVLLGNVFYAAGDTVKAKQIFANAIEKLPADQSQVIALGSAFEQGHFFAQAIETYKRGQRVAGKDYSYHNELANVYYYTRDYRHMTDEFVALIEENDAFKDMVQARMQSMVVIDVDNTLRDIFKGKLLEEIQEHPENVTLSEMLIWIFTQEKEFAAALVQAKSIDARKKEDGNRVFNLGNLALSNLDYDVAINCYQYVADKGKDFPLYEEARSNVATTLYKKILENPSHKKEEELKLDNLLREDINQLGITSNTTAMLIARAHLQAFFLNKADSAIQMLENALTINTLNLNNKSDIRMELGDIYLFTGDVWEANLVFAKVENDREGSPIAHEAKFRRARIAYYVGDFQWARALLDVLKAATSKETSNDAFELSLLISDNTVDDTVFTAMQTFARGDYLLFKNQDSLAIATFDSIPKLYPGNALEDDILFRKSKIYIKERKFELAAASLQAIIDRFSYEIYADDAVYTLAGLYETSLHDKDKAMALYKKLITDFSNSVYVIDARAKYRKLRGDKLE